MPTAKNAQGDKLELINGQWVPVTPDIVSGASPDLSGAQPDQLNAVLEKWATRQNKKEIAKLVEESPITNRLSAIAKGATFNFFDELTGQAGGLLGMPSGQVQELTDEMTREFARQNPVEAFGEELAGGAATSLVGGRAIPGLQGFALANPLKASAVFGAGTMGTALAGEAPFGGSVSDRLSAFAAGAGGGAALGPLGMFGGNLLTQKALPGIVSSMKGLFSTPQSAAADIVRPFMQDAFPEGIETATAKLNQLGPEATLLDVGETPVRALATGLTERDLGFKQKLTQQLAKRTRDGFRRIDRSIRNAMGTKGKEVAKTTTEINEKRFRESAPLYAQADNMTVEPNTVSGFIDDLDAQLADMQNVDIAKGLNKLRNGLFNDVPGGGKEVKTTVRQLVATRDDLTARINKAWKQENMKEWRLLTNWRNGFDESLMPDEFIQANKIFSSSKDVEDAMNAGSKMLRVDAEDLTELMQTYNSSQREAYLIGATKAIKQKIGSLVDGGKVSRVFNNPNVRERLGLVIGDEAKTARFLNDVEQENVFKATENIVLGNSATASRQQVQKIIGERAPVTSVSDLTGKIIKSVQTSDRIPKPVMNELSTMLTEQGLTPESLQAIMKTPLGNPTLKTILDFVKPDFTQPGFKSAVAPGLLGTQANEEFR